MDLGLSESGSNMYYGSSDGGFLDDGNSFASVSSDQSETNKLNT